MPPWPLRSLQWLALICSGLIAGSALAADEVTVAIRDHRFEPAEVRVPANRKVKLVITNHDATAEEFESHALNREKIVPPGGSVAVFIGPLAPGRYPFFGEYFPKTAQGVVIAE